jgi:hypothetical protein
MLEGKIHKVICSRCNSQHRYRPSLAAMKKKVRLPSGHQARVLKKIASAQASHPKEILEEWRRLEEHAGEVEPLPYDLNASYRKVIDASKIEVVFEHQIKILVMNRPKSE